MVRLVYSLITVIVISLIMLIVGGATLDFVQSGSRGYQSFFVYRIRHFHDLPYWFLAAFVLVGFNGMQLPRLARFIGNTQFNPFQQNGQIAWNIPVQTGVLLGRNLALICVLVLLFLFVQQMRL